MIKAKPRFYVAISKDFPGIGIASVVDILAKDVKEFYRDHAGHDIRHVDGEEMYRLMTAVPLQSYVSGEKE